MVELLYFLYLQLVDVFLESGEHAVVCHLRCVRYEREDGVFDVVVHCLQNLWYEQFTQTLALFVDVAV